MVDRNPRIRFMANNFTETATVTVSSEQAIYPKSNLLNKQRYKNWSPEGIFTIPDDLDYKRFHVFSPGPTTKSVVLDPGTYTGSELATEMTTKINAVTTDWTVTYDSSHLFTLSRSSGAAGLQLSDGSLLWDMIGFLGTSDRTGSTTYAADQIRIHDYETVDWDLQTPIETTFLAMIAKKSEQFTLSSSAVLTLRGDNVPLVVGTTAAFERTLTVSDEGVMEFLDDTEDTTFRYWQLIIQDRTNPLGPTGIKIGVLYLGDYITLTARGVARGFTKKKVDPSLKNTSESGAIYYKIKNKYWTFTNLSTEFLLAADRENLEQLFEDQGNHYPFFLSIDPTLCASTELSELTKYVRFEGDPSLVHVKTNTYSMGFNVREDL